jgi:hypothetical protein
MKEAKQRAEIGLLSLAEHYKHLKVILNNTKKANKEVWPIMNPNLIL